MLILFAPDDGDPPIHPVLTKNTSTLYFSIFSFNSLAYFNGCKVRNGPPKHGENVATGSVIPLSVPATFAVYPLINDTLLDLCSTLIREEVLQMHRMLRI